MFYNQFARQQPLKPSRGITDLSCQIYSFTAASTKRLLSHSTVHSSFFTAHNPTKQAYNLLVAF